MKHYDSSIEEVFEHVGSSAEGLTSLEAFERLQKNGPNKLAESKKIGIVKRFFMQLTDPMIIILLVAALVSGIIAVVEQESFADVIIILFVVLLNAVLGVYQENKAEKAIEALQDMSAATSKVLRDGQIVVIKSDELVKGDVVVLEAGDAVPADGRIIESASMKIEEAALTGESVPVNKISEIIQCDDKGVALGDRKNMVYMGSVVVYGRGKAVITETGMGTEMGKIADQLVQAEEGKTPLQVKLGQLSKTLSYLVIGICVFIFAFNLIRNGDFGIDTMVGTFMIAVSLAVAAIPEGLATVVTILLSIGVTNMSKRNAVIRKLTAVETLGCAQVICSDKTGTLTQNKMTVVEYFGADEKRLAECMALCSDAEFQNGEATGEPTECALVNYAAKIGLEKSELKAKAPRIGEAPFDSMRKMMSTVHDDSGSIVQYTKGAPDEVLRKCTHYFEDGTVREMTDEKRAEIITQNKQMADRALRVLCGAFRAWESRPESVEADYIENNLVFLGLMGMIDPVRPEVVDAIKECGEAGITPVMITGDHKDTAVAIAKQLNIISSEEQAITGLQLNDISDEELEQNISKYRVYARVQPEHKTRIVNAWRKSGYVTAMTGDGVNDAPSIKNADIGVGMGITGTDVTKNVADMVLADDNFATIVNAVAEGRRIYDNIRKAIQFLLASNLSEVLSIFFASILGFTVLKPVHLLWINLITDTFPALALGMEKGEADIMKRAPRNAKDGIFAGGLGTAVIWQGLMVTVITLASYFIGYRIENGAWAFADCENAITMAFLTMSMAEIFHSFNMRSRYKSVFSLKNHNKVLWGSMILSFILTTAVIYVPFLSDAFGFSHISFVEYMIAMGMAISVIPITEFVKLIQRKARKAEH